MDNNLKAEKISSLFTFISELSKSNKIILKNVKKENWTCFFNEIPLNNEYIEINYRDTFQNTENINFYNKPILQIKKPDFLPALNIKEEYKKWILGDWYNYKDTNVTLNEKLIIEKIIINVDGNEEKITEVENISFEDKKEILLLIEKRKFWVKKQEEIYKIRSFSDNFFKCYIDLNKNSEILEIVVGNGIIRINDICYPILLKKIKLEFDAEKNIFYIFDSDSLPFLYTDFLNEIPQLNLNCISQLENFVKEKELHPLDRNKISGFFNEFIHNLSPNGSFIKENINNNYYITIQDEPLFFIHKKEDGIEKTITSILKNIETDCNIPTHLLEIAGIADSPQEYPNYIQSSNTSLFTSSGESKEILFGKEANKEQLEIAEKIEKCNAVVVQGPPGTGKTHTIANLLGHFLAQGKNILVTSQTQKALKVLKDKIPKNIQDLCVSILDDNNKDMEKSIDGIVEKMGTVSSDKILKDINSLSDMRIKVLEDLNNIRKSIFEIKNTEYKAIAFNGESFSIKDAGIFVNENESKFNLIPGKIKEFVPCPVSNDELNFIYNEYNKNISLQEEKDISIGVIDTSLLFKPLHFKELIKKIDIINCEIIKIFKEIFPKENSFNFNIINNILYLNEIDLINLNLFKNIDKEYITNNILKKFTDLGEWKINACLDGMEISSSRIIWENFIKNIENLYYISEEIKLQLVDKQINLSSLEIVEAEKLINNLLEAFHSPGFFKAKLKNAKKEINNKITINNKNIENIEECHFLTKYLNYIKLKNDVFEKWNNLIFDETLANFDINDKRYEARCFNFLEKIKYFLYWDELQKTKIFQLIDNLGINKNILFDFTFEFKADQLKNILINLNLKFPLFINLGEKGLQLIELNNELKSFYDNFNINKKDSILYDQILECILSKDFEKYSYFYEYLENLHSKEIIFKKKKDIINRISSVAIMWGNQLKNNETKPIKENIYDIWKWKQLSQYLEKISSIPLNNLQVQQELKNKNFKYLTTQLIEKKAWFYLLSFIEKKENLNVKQALIGWKQTIKKIGKGTGKNVPRLKKEAKEKILDCQKAVPAWIMPINKVIDTLNPALNKFDIVIIDEASQSDITSLILLYMGKKIIIVGDDKQVSPSSIGFETEKINLLQERYIKGKIKNYDLFDLKYSLYALASSTYQPLMLKEHFRCVPEIIGYSNKTSYDYKIKPLREPNSSNLKPAVINYRVEGKREGKNKINRLEAETIVALIMACLEFKVYETSTFGVISLLGNEQVDLIQQLIIENIPSSKIEKHKILCGNPSQFQGDERDVIFLSMVDSKESEGPLKKQTEGTEDSYKKRYNVATSRAKNQMWLVHSLDKSNDLKDGDIRKELLDYTENPKLFLNLQNEIQNNSDSIFEKKVAEYLASKNYNLKQQWEVGAYRIDMVVSYQNKRIAIECDGDKFHSGEEKIREDMERQLILERCGWKFIRIRGSKYFRDPEKTMEEVVSQLNDEGIFPKTTDISENSFVEDSNSELFNQVKSKSYEFLQLIQKNKNNNFRIPETSFEKNKTITKNNSTIEISKETKIISDIKNIPSDIIEVENEPNIENNIFEFLKNYNLTFIDNREKTGLFWIIYNKENKEKIEDFLSKKNYQFSLEKRGSITTNGKPAWRIKLGEEENGK